MRVIKSAVANYTGITKFASFQTPGVHHILRDDTPADAQIAEVACVTLDDFVFHQNNSSPGFIKFDVEGAELELLKGAENLLSTYHPVVIGEVRKKHREQAVSFMTGLGYLWRDLYTDDYLSNILFTYPTLRKDL